MAISGLVHQAQLAADIERARKKVGPEAVNVSYRLDTDSTGEPSIFFASFWQTGQQWKIDCLKSLVG